MTYTKVAGLKRKAKVVNGILVLLEQHLQAGLSCEILMFEKFLKQIMFKIYRDWASEMLT